MSGKEENGERDRSNTLLATLSHELILDLRIGHGQILRL